MNRPLGSIGLAALFSVVLAWPGGARAQNGTSVLQGTVVASTTKQPVAEAVVTVTSPALQVEQIVVTDKAGFYRVPNLPPGEYLLAVDKDTFLRHERASIQLRADVTLRLNVDLIPEAARAEEVVVVVRPPNIDVGSSSVTTTVNEDMIRRVPLSRPTARGGGVRSFESVAEAAPQASNDRYGVGVSGTTSPENRYLIDGLSVNNAGVAISGSTLSSEFLRQVDVSTGGYMPEYGRATGGIVSASIKSGSNEIRGGAWSFVTPGFTEGTPNQPFDVGNTIKYDRPKTDVIWDAGTDVGFPIIKDRLWAYGGIQYSQTHYTVNRSLWATDIDPATGMPRTDADGNTLRTLIPGTLNSYGAQATQLQGLVKLSYSPNANHSFSFSSVATPYRSGSDSNYAISFDTGNVARSVNPGPFNATAGQRNVASFDQQLKWTASSASKKVSFDTTLGWHHQNDDSLPADGSMPGSGQGLAGTSGIIYRRSSPGPHSIADFESVPDGYCDPAGSMSATRCPVSIYQTNSVGYIDTERSNRFAGRSVMSVLAQALGHHVLKVGVDGEFTSFDITKAYGGGNLFRESSNGTNFADYRNYGYLLGPDDPVFRDSYQSKTGTFLIGGFVQDSWSIKDAVTVNAGLRYDSQYIYNSAGNLAMTLANQLSPRVGIIWDPTQQGRGKIFANYARYSQAMPLDLADRSLSGESGIIGQHLASGCDPTNAASARGPCRTDRSLLVNLPASGGYDPGQKWGGGGSIIPIDPDLKPNVTDELVVGGEYQVLGESRLGLTYNRRRMLQIIEDMSRDEANTYFIGNPGRGIANGFPTARRDYDAFTLSFSRNWYQHWLAQASYTMSWLYGNWSGLYRPETGQLDPGINSDFDLQSLLPNRTGYLPGDHRHQIKVFGAREFPIGRNHLIQVGVSVRASSGGPTDYLGSHVLYGEDEVSILPRGAGERLPWVITPDAQLSYGFAGSKAYAVSAILSCYNIFNLQAVAGRDETYTRADVLPVIGGKKADLANVINSDDGGKLATEDVNKNFGKPTAYQAPRIFQFGLRVTY